MNLRYYKSSPLILLILVLAVIFNWIGLVIKPSINLPNPISSIWDYLDPISTVSLIALSLAFINKFGWRYTAFKWLIDIPNLNGRYKGELISSYRDVHGNFIHKDCVVEIKQTASSIKIYSYYTDPGQNIQTSYASSVTEEIVKENNDLFTLHYTFKNIPDLIQMSINPIGTTTNIYNHEGACSFIYYPDNKTLEGTYFNQRLNHGTIKVKFIQTNILARFSP